MIASDWTLKFPTASVTRFGLFALDCSLLVHDPYITPLFFFVIYPTCYALPITLGTLRVYDT
jgi:hypothetical protein